MRIDTVSVIVTTFNEAHNVARCLDSLFGFDEVVVVDSFSSDDTVALVRRYPVMLYSRPYHSAADQKNWALGVVRNDWVLILDADEVLTPELRREIEALEPGQCGGYWIRRRSVYLGRRIRGCGWQRDRVLRLFDRRRGRYNDVAVHEEVSLDGGAGALRHHLLHYPYRDVHQHLEKINEYSSRGARDVIARGGKRVLWNMLVHPPFRLLRMYVFQLGIRDGREGVILCLLSAYSVFLKYAKAWELKWNRR